jgi:hypothetical protein
MKNKLVYAGILVALVVVVYFAFLYPWPKNETVTGTIDGAKKYNAQQLSDKDVKLEADQYTDAQFGDMEKQVGEIEARTAPNIQAAFLKARAGFIIQRLAGPIETKLAPLPTENKVAIMQLWMLQNALAKPIEEQVANLESRLAGPEKRLAGPEKKTAASVAIEERVNDLLSRLADPQKRSQLVQLPLESQVAAIQVMMTQKSMSMTLQEQVKQLESRLAGPEKKTAASVAIEARVADLMKRVAPPIAAMNISLPQELNITILQARMVENSLAKPIEAKVQDLESRLAGPEKKTAADVRIEARFDQLMTRVAPPIAAKLASLPLESKAAYMYVAILEKSTSLPMLLQVQNLESRLSPVDRTLGLQNRLDNIEQRLAVPQEARTAANVRIMERLPRIEANLAKLPQENRTAPPDAK